MLRRVIFVISTRGHGDVPQQFLPWWTQFFLLRSLPPKLLSHLRLCTVFGLGDSSFPLFNLAAKKLARRLRQLGASLALPLVYTQGHDVDVSRCVDVDTGVGLGDRQHNVGYDDALDVWQAVVLEPAVLAERKVIAQQQQCDVRGPPPDGRRLPVSNFVVETWGASDESGVDVGSGCIDDSCVCCDVLACGCCVQRARARASGGTCPAFVTHAPQVPSKGGACDEIGSMVGVLQQVANVESYIVEKERDEVSVAPEEAECANVPLFHCGDITLLSPECRGDHELGQEPAQKASPNSPYLARVVTNTRMTSEDHFQDVRHIVLDVSKPRVAGVRKPAFLPGDVMCFVPPNSDAVVDRFFEICQLDRRTMCRVRRVVSPGERALRESGLVWRSGGADQGRDTGQEWIAPPGMAIAARGGFAPLHAFVKFFFDFSASPTPQFFRTLAMFAAEERIKDKLWTLGTVQSERILYSDNEFRSYLEVLYDFRGVHRMSIESLFALIPRILPRYYSISSASVPGRCGELDLSVALVRNKARASRRVRTGVASRFFAQVKRGQHVPLWIQPGAPGDLRLPELAYVIDARKPLLWTSRVADAGLCPATRGPVDGYDDCQGGGSEARDDLHGLVDCAQFSRSLSALSCPDLCPYVK